MKAAVRTRYGPPEVVRVTEVDKPAPKDGEVLVKVHATTVNRTDCGVRAAKPFFYRLVIGPRRPRRTVLGTEYAGEVEAVGVGVSDFRVGDRVFGFEGSRFGAHAEYVSVPQGGLLATIPAGLSFEEAAPCTEGLQYAHSLVTSARLQPGQAVLVNGATGAIGSAAVQLLRHLGVEVTAVCGPDHLELVKRLGADRVIDFTAEDFTRDGQTYHVVLDAAGKSSFGRCRRLLRPGGVFLSTDLGPLSQNPFLALVTPLLGRRRVRFPIPRTPNRELVRHFRELIETGAFRPVIDRHYSLDEIVDAYRYVETGQKLGNVVIRVAPAAGG
jgi:NADPH:quinone reductase-like Zn-dependent oxidoreductase